MQGLFLLRLDSDKQRQCFSSYKRDKFYHLPEPALGIVNFCQKLSRDRLLRRDEILGAISMRIEVRNKFLAWKVTAIVRIKQRRRIMDKYLKHWHVQKKDTRLFRLYKNIHHSHRLGTLRALMRRWNTEFKINQILVKVRRRAMNFHFQGWCEYLRYQHQLRRNEAEVIRRRYIQWLRRWQSAYETFERRRAACVKIGHHMLISITWRWWEMLCVKRRHRRELLFSLYHKKLRGILNHWRLAMRLEIVTYAAVQVPELPACLSPQPARVPVAPSPKATPRSVGPAAIVPCKCM